MLEGTTEPERRPPADLDDYDVDLDDIFGDITPPPGQEEEGRKRKARENADAKDDEQVTKRARAPRVKLDEQRYATSNHPTHSPTKELTWPVA